MPPALYAQLYPASPIAHVRNVRAPVLLLLGTEDRRVVNVQGKAFFHALRALGRWSCLRLRGRDTPSMGLRRPGLGGSPARIGLGGRR
ncbi:hypothetical protein EDB84DRAFT_1482415, partial [Lactarius hengduanensis]